MSKSNDKNKKNHAPVMEHHSPFEGGAGHEGAGDGSSGGSGGSRGGAAATTTTEEEEEVVEQEITGQVVIEEEVTEAEETPEEEIEEQIAYAAEESRLTQKTINLNDFCASFEKLSGV